MFQNHTYKEGLLYEYLRISFYHVMLIQFEVMIRTLKKEFCETTVLYHDLKHELYYVWRCRTDQEIWELYGDEDPVS